MWTADSQCSTSAVTATAAPCSLPTANITRNITNIYRGRLRKVHWTIGFESIRINNQLGRSLLLQTNYRRSESTHAIAQIAFFSIDERLDLDFLLDSQAANSYPSVWDLTNLRPEMRGTYRSRAHRREVPSLPPLPSRVLNLGDTGGVTHLPFRQK